MILHQDLVWRAVSIIGAEFRNFRFGPIYVALTSEQKI